ncbi:hypothetical protein [Chitinophaga sancti]|uniref:Uncharacterized protein n=1 Tax=Chitinophaga sancti TaxID=1004 RepID=A0A1K1T0T0_9BACT|nr:hypothetical protein [Chitinophaga sancti]WQD59593.1 hypothetical protein U0033_17030 [Chitinophaga sancti]WQG88274.1 hypothetical protein SR876_25435 [Chitinophaga sancti]SFW90178.1 hypothetical protein SAMN05661012_06566 [Chitinophaga sancti]
MLVKVPRQLNGESLREIALAVKLNRETVAKYLRLEEPPEKSLPKKFDFSEFTDQILEIIRSSEGATRKYLIGELRRMGYSGGQTTAYKFLKENFNLQTGTLLHPLN